MNLVVEFDAHKLLSVTAVKFLEAGRTAFGHKVTCLERPDLGDVGGWERSLIIGHPYGLRVD